MLRLHETGFDLQITALFPRERLSGWEGAVLLGGTRISLPLSYLVFTSRQFSSWHERLAATTPWHEILLQFGRKKGKARGRQDDVDSREQLFLLVRGEVFPGRGVRPQQASSIVSLVS